MESPERSIFNKLDTGENRQAQRRKKNRRPSLKTDTVWGPLPCMLSGWGQGRVAAPGAAFNKAPSPLIVQPNDL